jgi:hypothetical protein
LEGNSPLKKKIRKIEMEIMGKEQRWEIMRVL